jgi:hypothetical protein
LRRREKNESGERGRFACVVERNARRFERPPGAGDTRGYPRHRVHTRHAYARHRASPMVHARSDVFRIHSSRDRNLFASKLWTTRPGNRSLTSARLKAHTKKTSTSPIKHAFRTELFEGSPIKKRQIDRKEPFRLFLLAGLRPISGGRVVHSKDLSRSGFLRRRGASAVHTRGRRVRW